MANVEGVTYRAVLGNREFATILLSQGLSASSYAVAGLPLLAAGWLSVLPGLPLNETFDVQGSAGLAR